MYYNPQLLFAVCTSAAWCQAKIVFNLFFFSTVWNIAFRQTWGKVQNRNHDFRLYSKNTLVKPH